MCFHRVLAVTLGAGLLWYSAGVSSADEKAAETTEVKHRDLTLKVPKAWQASDVVSSMRLATYDIPAAKGDKEKGELTISTFGGDGGGVAANLDRWVGQFEADGRKVAIRKGKAGENVYHIADISGTFKKSSGPPFAQRPGAKTELAPGYRMLAVILQVKGKGVYFLKLTGPDATVSAQSENMRLAIGADSGDEQDYEL